MDTAKTSPRERFRQRANELPADWLTRKQLLWLAGCSQMTLKKWLREDPEFASTARSGPRNRQEYPAQQAVSWLERKLFDQGPEGRRRPGPQPKATVVDLTPYAAPGIRWTAAEIARLRQSTHAAVGDLALAYGGHAAHPFPPVGEDRMRDSVAVAAWYVWYDSLRGGYGAPAPVAEG